MVRLYTPLVGLIAAWYAAFVEREFWIVNWSCKEAAQANDVESDWSTHDVGNGWVIMDVGEGWMVVDWTARRKQKKVNTRQRHNDDDQRDEFVVLLNRKVIMTNRYIWLDATQIQTKSKYEEELTPVDGSVVVE